MRLKSVEASLEKAATSHRPRYQCCCRFTGDQDGAADDSEFLAELRLSLTSGTTMLPTEALNDEIVGQERAISI